MSSSESGPYNPIHNIVDQQGVPIVESAQDQVSSQRKLAREQRVASVEAKALDGARTGKVQELQDLFDANDNVQNFSRENRIQQGEIQDEAIILTEAFNKADSAAFAAERKLQQNDQEAAAHVAENLPQYVEVATRLANADLRRRLGQKVIIHSQEEPVVDFGTVTLVEPATSNEDVAHLQTPTTHQQ